jgi:hypothetical protein
VARRLSQVTKVGACCRRPLISPPRPSAGDPNPWPHPRYLSPPRWTAPSPQRCCCGPPLEPRRSADPPPKVGACCRRPLISPPRRSAGDPNLWPHPRYLSPPRWTVPRPQRYRCGPTSQGGGLLPQAPDLSPAPQRGGPEPVASPSLHLDAALDRSQSAAVLLRTPIRAAPQRGSTSQGGGLLPQAPDLSLL